MLEGRRSVPEARPTMPDVPRDIETQGRIKIPSISPELATLKMRDPYEWGQRIVGDDGLFRMITERLERNQ